MSIGKRNLQPSLGHAVTDIVRADHRYRRLLAIVPFDELCAPLGEHYSKLGRTGYAPAMMFKACLLQWLEDLSDRQLERLLDENLAAKLFCGLELGDPTPDHSALSDFRKRVGVESLAALFNRAIDALKDAGLVREVFTFVDATKLVSKENMWRERDKVEEANEKLSNETVAAVAVDPEARFGSKGGTKWYGYKIHAGVDMSQGFITKVDVTPANVEDTKGVRAILPSQGMVFGDKAYGVGDAALAMQERGLHNGSVLKNDMNAKDHDKDRWLAGVRMPYESTFSRFEKRARYKGTEKCRFQAYMQSLAHNFKRLLVIGAPRLVLRPNYA